MAHKNDELNGKFTVEFECPHCRGEADAMSYDETFDTEQKAQAWAEKILKERGLNYEINIIDM